MLSLIPNRFKLQWVLIFVALAVAFSLLLITSVFFPYKIIDLHDLINNTIYGFVISFVCCIGGFFGAKLYSLITTAFIFAGLLYLAFFRLTLSEAAPDYELLGGAIILGLTLMLSLIIGIIAQIVYSITQLRNKRKVQNREINK